MLRKTIRSLFLSIVAVLAFAGAAQASMVVQNYVAVDPDSGVNVYVNDLSALPPGTPLTITGTVWITDDAYGPDPVTVLQRLPDGITYDGVAKTMTCVESLDCSGPGTSPPGVTTLTTGEQEVLWTIGTFTGPAPNGGTGPLPRTYEYVIKAHVSTAFRAAPGLPVTGGTTIASPATTESPT
jgi:hypothetical protein